VTRSNATIPILLIMFGALLVISFLLNASRPRPEPTSVFPTEAPYLFPGTSPTNITRITISALGETRRTVTLERTPGRWRGTDQDGREVAIDPAGMPDTLLALAGMRYNPLPVGAESAPERYGLGGEGRFLVDFLTKNSNDSTESSYTLRIGDSNLATGNVYARAGTGETILLVPYEQVAALVQWLVSEPTQSSTP
jgi:hypothetical protein